MARGIFGDEIRKPSNDSKDVSLSDMYLDLDFDKDECEKKLSEHESNLNLSQQYKNNFERQSKFDMSNYLLKQTVSSLKMKSQFQISKKQFLAKIGKDKSKVPPMNFSSSSDKLTHQYSTHKNSSNMNSAYGTIRTSTSVSSLGSESVVGKRKFNSARISNDMNLNKNTELIVESYGFLNKPEPEEFVVDTKTFDESPSSETASKKSDASGRFSTFYFTRTHNSWKIVQNCTIPI